MRVVTLAKDLNVTSKLNGFARHPHETEAQPTLLRLVASLEQRSADLVLVDLTCQAVDRPVASAIREANRQPCLLAVFGPHVQEQKLAVAADARCDHVWARGQWERELRELLRE